MILKGGTFSLSSVGSFDFARLCDFAWVLLCDHGKWTSSHRYLAAVLSFHWRCNSKAQCFQVCAAAQLACGSRVPIHEAIRIATGAMNNALYKEFLNSLRQSVERGEKIAENLALAPFLFPETVVAMVSVGESSGQLGKIAEKLAVHYEQEVEHSLENFTTLLEPIVIVIVGVAVGVLALALLGPIFSLSTLVS